MDNAEKAREALARRKLDRRGFTLSRSRRRDTGAVDYGRYTIRDQTGEVRCEAPELSDVEQWIEALDRTRQIRAALPGGAQ
jgi:hypothetical protein